MSEQFFIRHRMDCKAESWDLSVHSSFMRWLCALLVVLVACGGATSENGTTTTGSTAIGEVTLTRSGGLAGILTTLTVGPDGSVLVTDDSEPVMESVLDADDLDNLHSLIGSPEFAGLSRTYVPAEGVCCDFFFYTVTAQIGDRTLESSTADTIDTPPALQQVIDLLVGLMP